LNLPALSFNEDMQPDVDAVLTSRELVRLFKFTGIEFEELLMMIPITR